MLIYPMTMDIAALWKYWGINTGYASPNTDNDPGISYPCPRQNGLGHVTGTTSVTVNKNIHLNLTGTVTVGSYSATGIDDVSPPCYLGGYCPWYQANNTGAGNYTSLTGLNYATPGTTYDSAADYFFSGADDTDAVGDVKPGWINATSGLLAARPGSANTGAAYYATDNETLYVYTGGAWTTYWTKYTYPHPLRTDLVPSSSNPIVLLLR